MTQRFDGLATQWDEDPKRVRMAEAVAEVMTRHLSLHQTQTLLEYGAGTGLIALRLYPYVRDLIALDSSDGMLAVLKNKLKRWNVETIQPRMGSWEGLGDLKDCVDVIVSSMTLHHVRDTSGILKAFHQTLRTGGQLAIADLDEEDGSFHGEPGVAEHKGFNREMFRQKCEDAGFEQIRFENAYSMVKSGKTFSVFLMTAQKK
jgi:ubiquinone/menaquinone biosynthesis C-methylase UbiE